MNSVTFWMMPLCQKGITQKVLPNEQKEALLPVCEGFQWRFPVRTMTKPDHFAV